MRVGAEPHAVEADQALWDRPWGGAPCGRRGIQGGRLAQRGEGPTRLPRTPRGPWVLCLPCPREDTFFLHVPFVQRNPVPPRYAGLEAKAGSHLTRANIQPRGAPSPRTAVKRTHLSPRSWSHRQSRSPGVCAATKTHSCGRVACCRHCRLQGQQRSASPLLPYVQLWSNRSVAR